MAPRKSSPKRSSPRRSPVRSTVKTVGYTLEEVDVGPSREIFRVMNYLAYLFVLTALAAGVAWIYYVAVAKKDDDIGQDTTNQIDTASICFQASVVSALLYFVARHHFRHTHH